MSGRRATGGCWVVGIRRCDGAEPPWARRWLEDSEVARAQAAAWSLELGSGYVLWDGKPCWLEVYRDGHLAVRPQGRQLWFVWERLPMVRATGVASTGRMNHGGTEAQRGKEFFTEKVAKVAKEGGRHEDENAAAFGRA
jgi:hypothetical protein